MHSPAPAVSISQAKRPIALAVRGLAKRFDRPAVDALDLTVYGGEFYVLVGPNGAGKTTTLRMVAGLLRPDAGSITIDGIDALADPVAAKQITAWLSDEPMIYDKLTPFEYLEFVAGLWRIEAKPAEARARAGGTVIMTTHILEVAERMADRIGVIASGRLIAEGTLEELHRKTGKTAASLEDTFLTLVAEPVAQPIAAE